MDAQHVVFCLEDTVGLADDRYSVGIIERCFGDVESHEPRPQRDYVDDIQRHPDIPAAQFATFMRDGIPPRGTVLVAWQTQYKTELIPEEKLQLLDRALYVGDIVKRRAEDHISGTVIGTRATTTLFPATQFNGGQITQPTTDEFSIREVPAEELINVHEFVEGALVVYGDWVGRVENVYDDVAIKLANNSVVVVEDPAELEQDDTTVERLSVGDTCKTKKGNLRRGRWKFGAYDPSVAPVGVVVETRACEIDVQWLARSIGARNAAFSALEPPATLGRDEFESPTFYKYDASGGTATTLPLSENGVDKSYHVTDVAVGDRVRFKDIAGAAVKYDGSKKLPNGLPQGKVTRIPRTESLGYDLNVYLVMQTHSQVTVQWQDLSVTHHLSSSLIPDPNVEDDDEVWPGEIVFSKEKCPNSDTDIVTKKPKKVGIVQTVKARDRIATVRWFETPKVEFFGPNLLPPCTTGELSDAVEDVSLYDIYSFQALTRRRGDFVIVNPDAIGQSQLNVTGPNWFGEVIDLGLDGKLTVRLGAAKPVVDVKVPYESVTLAYSSDMADDFLEPNPLDGDSIDSDTDDEPDFDSASFNEMWIDPDILTQGPAPFLILEEAPPPSHHYLSHTSASSSTFMRRIAKEHKILRTSLPPGIYVRTWESRLDLLRVLMIGPNDTPYEYAPFVIDFHLSSTYPQQAPEAYFHSWTNGNGPVNPNLYEDGKICLSLLGTWHTDERNESWSPAKSTLLQVLVSIMGLVLVKEPYYNEAGYDVHRSAPETKLSSALYTERAYFRARAFIIHALTHDVAPFNEELTYLYRSTEDGAPRLLDKAIQAAKEIVERSSDVGEEGERDGLTRVSKGALVILKRHLKDLEEMRVVVEDLL
ncbi:Ubiquitin-protein ligase [Pyrenophora tritici-repentis]|nr:Ubiquitin-protein ligase [Pyrenophora tritici-repentis]KAF7452239.1 Ubiquitin-protein ligase [Pyrenophora tritici-repentis]KAG9386581.1 Ubiquitin-protein ligase [Pyrenophora tritici-repentis]KAI1581138.1 Ubiquitin-protein ligase [Pyrenophora tritici-repentis]KAI1603467.1 Ubiquitin-protein ligase [Pyrenophora tritici-repentis]